MADNVAITAGAGTSISTDDVGAGLQVQRVKVQYGADGSATDVAPANGLPIAASYAEFTGSATANNIDLVAQDVSAYRWVSVQLTVFGNGVVSFQASNDNTNWVSAQLMQAQLAGVSVVSTSATGMWSGPLPGRYFRVRTTTYSSGTMTAFVNFSGQPAPAGPVSNVNVATGSTSSTSDGLTQQWASVNAYAYSFNGTNWDRARSFGTQGALGVTPTPGTTGGWSVSSQTALTNTVVSVKSSAGTFGGYMIYNSNATVAYVQVFNVASGSVTLGTTAPTYVLSIPPTSAANLELTCGVNHSTAISVAATGGTTTNATPGTALVAALFFK